ncbi:hypothetical protein SAMN05444285_12350 [Draconibacterium orientale]|uniref:Uncharacterized protein n=1 Tax=Draconibacterium orientale TaxID=1168034 RepID=X5E3W6_9BACT|nr:hypothetical protein [Draconibacterium orientale]AHW62155.1 hypothetical protein FH5T_16250 [Draconibacterium orientale]SET78723.1 hypothetical protein SAMN05444285_12350 [Draconibacterium orientale]
MSDDFNTGSVTLFMWLLTIAISIGAGVLTWNWIEPDNFWGFFGFLFAWGILSKIGHLIVFGLFAALFGRS